MPGSGARLIVVALAAWLALPATAQRPEGFPDVDPMAEASCDVTDGWMTVFSDYASALMKAKTDGRIVDPLLTQLSVWYVQQQNRIIDTNDVRGVCLDTIAMRRRHGF